MKTSRFLYQKIDVLSKDVKMSLSYDGIELTDQKDIAMLRDAFKLWVLTMWDLAAPIQRVRLYDVLPQLFLFLCGCDVKHLIAWLDKVRSVLYGLPTNTSLAIDTFKGYSLGGRLTSGHLIVPMRPHCNSLDGSSYRALNSILCFLLKLNIKLDVEAELESQYVADEDRLRNFQFDDHILDDLNKIIKKWTENWVVDVANPKHGPGAVSGYSRIPVSKKYPLLGTDDRLTYALRRDRDSFESDYVRPIQKLDRTAEIVFVPKSLKTYRVICKEPATLQYWQQYYAALLIELMKSNVCLRRHITLDNQQLSRRFCLEASTSGDYATIDLSKASDTVSLQLIKRIFRGTPLLRALVATRSDRVRLPSGETITTAKFAPMGSALCFPIECMVFAAACELAIARSSGRHTRYRVYGDDIIIHREHVPDLLRILDCCAFLPNQEKSYTDPKVPYRESCGMEAYLGMNVSPVRLSRWFIGLGVPSDRDIPRLIDLANTLYANGLMTARRAVLKPLLALRYPPLFTIPDGIGLWSDTPSNFTCKRKKVGSEKWLLHGTLLSKSSDVVLANEDIRLHEWHRQGGSPDGAVSIEKTRVVWQATTSPSWFTRIEVAGE